jgi:hypothetical protein
LQRPTTTTKSTGYRGDTNYSKFKWRKSTGGGKAVKMVPIRKTAKGLRVQGKAADRAKSKDVIMHMVKGTPGPDELPAGMAPPPHQGPPPPPSKPKIKAKSQVLKNAQAKARAARALLTMKTMEAQKEQNLAPKLESAPQAEKLKQNDQLQNPE